MDAGGSFPGVKRPESEADYEAKDRISKLLKNGIYQQVHTALKPIRPTSTSLSPWEPEMSQEFFSREWTYITLHFHCYYLISNQVIYLFEFSLEKTVSA
jgi:hypothetical protein